MSLFKKSDYKPIKPRRVFNGHKVFNMTGMTGHFILTDKCSPGDYILDGKKQYIICKDYSKMGLKELPRLVPPLYVPFILLKLYIIKTFNRITNGKTS